MEARRIAELRSPLQGLSSERGERNLDVVACAAAIETDDRVKRSLLMRALPVDQRGVVLVAPGRASTV